MSTYVREKVLRIPMDKIFGGLDWYDNKEWETGEYLDDIGYYLEQRFKEYYDYGAAGKFQSAPTEEMYIDFVLEREYDFDGEYGKTRALYNSEMNTFLPIFQRLNSNFNIENMRDVRLAEFCWYNSTEAPDYYSDENDEFYKEVTWTY